MRRNAVRLGVVIVLFLIPVSVVWAEDLNTMCPICRRANDQRAAYHEKASLTLARGALNTAFGWTELLIQPTAEASAGGNLFYGVGKGVGYAIRRTAVGVGELFTFWAPKGKQGYFQLANNCPICLPPAQGPLQADRQDTTPPTSASPIPPSGR